MELAIVKIGMQQKKPILGICRGCQVLNVALGGTLYQDLVSQKNTVLKHSQQAPRGHASHTIEISKNSILYQIYQSESTKVNSYHHQALKRVSPELSATAYATDGTVEAVEGTGDTFLLAVQWHPEGMVPHSEETRRLFAYFIQQCTSV